MRWGKRYTFLLVMVILVFGGIFLTRAYWQPRLFGGYFARERDIAEWVDIVSGLLTCGAILVSVIRFLTTSPVQREKAYKLDEILERTSPEKIIEAYVGSRGGKVDWVDRGVGAAPALRAQRSVAIVGRMKSGKSREAAEVLRCALAEEWVLPQQAFDLTRALQPFQPELVKDYLSRRIDRGAPSFFYINDLPAQFPLTGLEGLEAALEVLAQCPRAHLLVTARSDQLSPAYRAWLVKHGFTVIELPRLTAEQCADLVRKAAEVLNLTLDEAAVQVFVEHSDGTTGQPLLALLRMVNTGILSAGEEEARPYARTSLLESWAEVRTELSRQDALVASVLQALALFWRANVPARRELVRRFTARLARRRISQKRFALLENLLKDYEFSLHDEDCIRPPDAAVESLAPALEAAQDQILAFLLSQVPPRWLWRFRMKGMFNILAAAFFDIGGSFYYSRRLDQAEKAWCSALDVDPQYALAWYNLGLLLVEKGINAEAESAWRKGLDVVRQTATKWYELGMLFKSVGKSAEAEAAWRTEHQANLLVAQFWKNLGLMYKKQGRIKETEVAYRYAAQANPKDSLVWYSLGVLLMEQGKPKEAETAYLNSVKIDPQLAAAWYNLGRMVQEQGRPEEAEAAYRRVVDVDPQNAAACYNLGVLFDDHGRLEEAEAAYRRAVEVDPKLAAAWNNLAVLLDDQGKFEEAEAAYRKAIQVDPQYVDVWYNLGVLLEKQGWLEEAEAAYRRAVQVDSRYVRAWSNLGVLLDCLGRPEEAEAAYRMAIQIDPHYADAWYNLGLLLQKQDRQEEAEAAYRSAVEADPKLAAAWNNLGLLLKNKGRLEEAETAYRSALKADPKLAAAWANLGVLLQEQGRLEEAEAAYRSAVDADPKYARAWTNLGTLLKKQGRLANAEAAYRSAVEADPKLAAAWNNLGLLLKNQGRPEEAETAYCSALAADPKLAAAWNNLGSLLRGRKAYAEARQVHLDALAIYPENAVLHAGLGYVCHKLGEAGAAVHAFSEARRLSENERIYNRACILALCGDAEGALALLREALDGGETDRAWVRQDPDWQEFREDPRWLALVNQP